MCAFRRVSVDRAGPSALGILVPPGRHTNVVLRPRTLIWDLLLVKDGQTTAATLFSRDEAAAAARNLFHALEAWAGGGVGRMVLLSLPRDEGFLVRTEVGPFCLITCLRTPGQSYRPAVLASLGEAQEAAARIAAVLCPAADVEQECYFNTQNFAPAQGE